MCYKRILISHSGVDPRSSCNGLLANSFCVDSSLHCSCHLAFSAHYSALKCFFSGLLCQLISPVSKRKVCHIGYVGSLKPVICYCSWQQPYTCNMFITHMAAIYTLFWWCNLYLTQAESLPRPFPIPKFRPNTEANMQKKVLTDTDRKYMVQTLATMLMTYIQRPSMHQCGVVAKALVDMYGFLKDDHGDGEVSNCNLCLHCIYMLCIKRHCIYMLCINRMCLYAISLCSIHGSGSYTIGVKMLTDHNMMVALKSVQGSIAEAMLMFALQQVPNMMCRMGEILSCSKLKWPRVSLERKY